MSAPRVRHFHHADSDTLSWVISDPGSGAAAVVDAVLGLDLASGRIDAGPVDEIIAYLREHSLKLRWILETHVHADHLSGAQYLKATLGGDVAIGKGVCDVQAYFASVFNLKSPFRSDGRQFDRLLDDGDEIALGGCTITVIATPGHTSDSVSYRAGDAVFVGDTLFAPDLGTARCDFPGGDAGRLYDSITRLLDLPPDMRLCLCHDYPPAGRELRVDASVREQRETNVHVGEGRSRDDFIALREGRDRGLGLPRLILPALQVNIRAGNLPPAEDNQVAYLKIPLDHF